jgi:hypothetical protein
MPWRKARSGLKPREERRRVVLPAQLRNGASWTDACILNRSSRGLMVHMTEPPQQGSYVELRKGAHVIVARVIWSDSQKAGLCAQDRLDVEHIVTSAEAPQLQLTAEPCRRTDPLPRGYGDSRLQGRAMEFASVVAVGIFFAATVCALVSDALALPLADIQRALSG